MSLRTIVQLIQGMATQDGAGVALKRIIGQPALKNLDPFLLLDEFGSNEASDYIAGFPEHPHRGFQTVTYMLEGKMAHKDSAGNSGVIETGGLQWMNAGRGILHSEMPLQTEGLMRGFQLWVNLPSAHKMSEPGYQDIPASQIPVIEPEEGVKVKVLAGVFLKTRGPVTTAQVQPLMLDIALSANRHLSVPIPQNHNCFIQCFEGSISVEGQPLAKGQLAVLSPGTELKLHATEAARVLLVAGAPIGESVVQYGPFVMNTEAEIRQALADYRAGTLTSSTNRS